MLCEIVRLKIKKIEKQKNFTGSLSYLGMDSYALEIN